jgi:hypothetical protein
MADVKETLQINHRNAGNKVFMTCAMLHNYIIYERRIATTAGDDKQDFDDIMSPTGGWACGGGNHSEHSNTLPLWPLLLAQRNSGATRLSGISWLIVLRI